MIALFAWSVTDDCVVVVDVGLIGLTNPRATKSGKTGDGITPDWASCQDLLGRACNWNKA